MTARPCERCGGEGASYFTESYTPSAGTRTYWLCLPCQLHIARIIEEAIEEGHQ